MGGSRGIKGDQRGEEQEEGTIPAFHYNVHG